MTDSMQRSRILIVDDVRANVKILVETLRNDYNISVAMDGLKALELVEVEHPDLILLDVIMPGIDGYEVCNILKHQEHTCDIPIIFVTAKDDAQDETKGFMLGAVDYITKPFIKSVVEARVKTHLKLKQARELIQKQNGELLKLVQLREDVDRILHHDLKSPLNAIIGIPSLLMEELTLEESHQRYLRIIEESGYRMLEMINRSHDLYKMECGTYKLNKQPVDILIILKRIYSEFFNLIKKKSLYLDIFWNDSPVAPGDSFMVSGEELLCHSMLANLIKNALEASPVGQSVKVFLEDGDMDTLRIENMGEVPMEIRHTFFDKYVTSGKQHGVGLGTYSVKLIVTTLDGRVMLDTSRHGKTSLVIQLPK
ncbi:MAG: hybrid sensor histidine kinase/response regulator [Magnetococcus sp. DMHC-6]